MNDKPMTPEQEKRSREEIAALLDGDSKKYGGSYTAVLEDIAGMVENHKYATTCKMVLHDMFGVCEDAPGIWATLDEERAAHALTRQELAKVRSAPTSDEEFETLLRQGTSAIREALGPHWRPGPDGQRERQSRVAAYLSTVECVRRVVAERDAALAELRRLRRP